MQKRSFTINLALALLLAGTLGRAEAKDKSFKGEFAGTFLTMRIDLNNDGALASWSTAVVKSNLGRSSNQGVDEDAQIPPTGPVQRASLSSHSWRERSSPPTWDLGTSSFLSSPPVSPALIPPRERSAAMTRALSWEARASLRVQRAPLSMITPAPS
jgi:hypothetical protein